MNTTYQDLEPVYQKPTVMTREEVYKVIDTERDFQEKMIADPTRPDMIQDLHVGDTITAIQYNLNKALEAWYKGSVPHQYTMEFLRKIAALCVQAGETYGMPQRTETPKYAETFKAFATRGFDPDRLLKLNPNE